MRRKDDTMAVLDSILFSTKFSSRTKALYRYFTQGEKILHKTHMVRGYLGEATSLATWMEQAQDDKALALYMLNMHANGSWFRVTVASTRPATLTAWRTAVRLIDSARAQLRI